MGPEQNGGVALLPIQPDYARAIIDGKKKVEFRRRKFRSPVEFIVIYATSPIRRIVAFFRVSHIIEGAPCQLWTRYKHVAGMREEEFRAYYSGAAQAVAIGIAEVVVLSEPLPLESVGDSLSPPQSFVYLHTSVFEKICKRAGK